jgi:hypothetical protein
MASDPQSPSKCKAWTLPDAFAIPDFSNATDGTPDADALAAASGFSNRSNPGIRAVERGRRRRIATGTARGIFCAALLASLGFFLARETHNPGTADGEHYALISGGENGGAIQGAQTDAAGMAGSEESGPAMAAAEASAPPATDDRLMREIASLDAEIARIEAELAKKIPAAPHTSRPATRSPQPAEPTRHLAASAIAREPPALTVAPAASPAAGAAVPPHPAPAAPKAERKERLSESEVEALVTRGDAFFTAGDVASARLYYEYGAAVGNGEAALRLGNTFDPAFLAQARLRYVSGDIEKAAYWYARARDLGNADADVLLRTMEDAAR